MRLVAGAFSHTGRVRSNNEDSVLVDDEGPLYAVADGMGGHRGGEVASRTAIEGLRAAIANGRPVNEAISKANDAVLERAAGDDELSGMGTTMTAVVVAGPRQLLVGHVGDSRAYVLHDGALRRVTEDHSLVEELVREGRLTQEQAEVHPQRAIVTRALGVDADVEVDLYTLEVAPRDRVILCSDGLTTMVRENDIERMARAEADPQRLAETLVDAANTAGGEDNTSVVVIDVVEVDAESAIDPDRLAASGGAAAAPAPMRPAPDVPRPAIEMRDSWPRRIRNVALLFLPLILILGAAFAGVAWYARSSYYVGLAGDHVVVYKGIPGGVLGWNPTIDERTNLTARQLTQADHDQVAAGAARGSRSRAERYVANLRADVAATSTTTTTRPTTTTRHRTTTTVANGRRPPTSRTRATTAR